MITDGTKLTNLAMVKRAMEQGFALKIVENVFIEGECYDKKGEWVYWHGTEVQVHYVSYIDDVHTIEHQYIANGEIFAVPLSEYDEWYELNYPDWDEYGDNYEES